jgi:hypothetical protein
MTVFIGPYVSIGFELLHMLLPNTEVKWLAPLIQELVSSIIGLEARCSEVHDFFQSLQENVRIVHQNIPHLLPLPNL